LRKSLWVWTGHIFPVTRLTEVLAEVQALKGNDSTTRTPTLVKPAADAPADAITCITYLVPQGLSPKPFSGTYWGRTGPFDMQSTPAPPPDTSHDGHHRCPCCMRRDTVRMPVENLLDKLVQHIRYVPFKCRACRTKFYRKLRSAPARPSRLEDSPRPEIVPPRPQVVPSMAQVIPPRPPSREPRPDHSVPARNMAVCQGDRESTMRRVENIIRTAEVRRLRGG
jgi:hypothetical protein